MTFAKYLKILLIRSLSAAIFVVSPTVFALQVEGLYQYRILVTSDSDAERNRAFAEALSGVIVKVSGEKRWLEHPDIKAALANPEGYVESISYSSEPGIRSLLGQINNELFTVAVSYTHLTLPTKRIV